MNKPVIQGTKKHSALLKTAKAEQVRTHGGDPSLIEASALYGASNSPDVIDYKIKQAEIKWGKKKKKKTKTKVEKDTSVTEVTTPTPTEVSTEEALTEVPTITELEKLTVNERNWEIAKADEKAAKKRLEDYAARKRYESIETTKIDPKQKQPIKTELKENIILPKKREKIEVITSEPPKVQSIEGVSTSNLKTSYTDEEQKRLIFSEEHGRMVLPEEIGIKPDVIIDKSTIERKDKRKLNKAEEGKSQKTAPPAHLRNQYKKLSQFQKWQMEKKYRKYQF